MKPRTAGEFKRVCRPWHEASRAPVPIPGGRRAEGEPKGRVGAAERARRGLGFEVQRNGKPG
jgi:hypothetical protein